MIPFPYQFKQWLDSFGEHIPNEETPELRRLRASRTAAWTLLLDPEVTGPALIIAKQPSASIFLLGTFFEKVHLFIEQENEVHQLQSLTDALLDGVEVFSWGQIDDVTEQRTYNTLIIENAIRSFGAEAACNLFKKLKAKSTTIEQIAVVSANPWGWGVTRERLRLKRIKPYKLQAGDSGASSRVIRRLLRDSGAKQLHQHPLFPNAAAPREILGRWRMLPLNRRSTLATLTEKLGVLPALHNGNAHVGFNGEESNRDLLNRIIRVAAKAMPGESSAEIVWVRCLETGSLILELLNAPDNRAMLKIALSAGAATSSSSHLEATASFRSQFPWAEPLLPAKLASGTLNGLHYALETKISGAPGNELIGSERSRHGMKNSAAEFLSRVGEQSAKTQPFTNEALEKFIDSPIERLTRLMGRSHCEPLHNLGKVLRSALDRIPVPFVFAHGDFNAKNLIFDTEDLSLNGVIDWDSTDPACFPLRDLVDFLVSLHRFHSLTGYESVVTQIAQRKLDDDLRIIEQYAHRVNLKVELTLPMLALCWLRYAADTVTFQVGSSASSKIQSISHTADVLTACIEGTRAEDSTVL